MTDHDLPFDNSDDILTGPTGSAATQFKKGNEDWKKRQTHGRPKAIGEPMDLWDYFLAYMEELDANPWTKDDFRGKDADRVTLKFKLPLTWAGFDNYLFGLELINDLDDYKRNTNGAYDSYQPILSRIGKVIYDQKFTGATIGFFNHSIISRDLGLVDQKAVASTTTILSLGSGINPEDEDATS